MARDWDYSQLGQDNIIYMLGGPNRSSNIYRHADKRAAEIGLKTAGTIVENYLTRMSAKAKEEIKIQQLNLFMQEKRLSKIIYPATLDQFFTELNNTQDERFDLSLSNIVHFLLPLKVLAAKSSFVRGQLREKGKQEFKIGNQTFSREALQKQDHAFRTAIAKEIDKWGEAKIFLLLSSTLTNSGNRVRANAVKEFQNKLGSDFEILSAGLEIDYDSRFKIRVTNLSQSFKTGPREEYYNKADTLFEFIDSEGKVFFSFTTSDKTGGAIDYNSIAKQGDKWDESFSLIPTFTGSLSDTLKTKTEGRILLNDNNLDTNFQAAARYIGMNADPTLVGRNSEFSQYRKDIVAAVVWSGLIVHVTGLIKPNDPTKSRTQSLPLFIRHFDEYFKTKDILDDIYQQSDQGIISKKFVVQSYLDSWLKPAGLGQDQQSSWATTVYPALSKIERVGNMVPYESLYYHPDIQTALSGINKALKPQTTLNVSLRIILAK